jgi:hypothetical protein
MLYDANHPVSGKTMKCCVVLSFVVQLELHPQPIPTRRTGRSERDLPTSLIVVLAFNCLRYTGNVADVIPQNRSESAFLEDCFSAGDLEL